MARPLRIEFADALYHVMSRGNDRRPIVRDDADRQRRCEWLARRRFGYKVQEIAEALGYHSPDGAVTAIRRVEASFESLNRTLRRMKGQLAND